MMLPRLRAVVFDLDGTLLYTLEDLAAATNWALRRHGMPERTLDEVRRFVGNGVRQLMVRAVSHGDANPLFEQTFSDFRRYYVGHCRDHTRLYDGIPEMLAALKARGLRLAVVSNKLQAGVDELCARYFRRVVEVAVGDRPDLRRKPAPDMVQLALRQLGVSASEAVYVGDSDVDLQTARASGLPCISVLWGFRDRDFLVAQGAQTLAATPADVVRALLS